MYYLQRYKNETVDTILIKYYELKQFQSDGESSREPLVKGAGLQMILFPQISLQPGLAFNPSTPWAGRLAHQPPGIWNNGTFSLARVIYRIHMQTQINPLGFKTGFKSRIQKSNRREKGGGWYP